MSTIQIGIDLGTTNTLVYGKINGKIKPVKINGSVTIPSVLYVKEDGEEIIGKNAKQREYGDPDNGIRSSKTYMGDNKHTWTIRGKTYTPTDVAERILKTVYNETKKKFDLKDDDIIQAIITIPAYFTANQSDETKKAGERAGFEVLRIITEPVAAAYNINPQENGIICVIDLGGGTFDVSIVDKQKEKYSVLAIAGDPRLGGDDFDKALEKYFLNDIEDDLGIDLSTLEKSGLSYESYYNMKRMIRQEATRCKEDLSDDEESSVIINDLFTYGDNKVYHYDTEVTREQFNEICKDIYTKIMSVVKGLIDNNSKFKKSDIKNVYLVGGSCYIPKIRELIEDYFGMAANSEGGLEEQVAQGAAKIADGYNTPVVGENTDPFADYIQDITSHSMGIKIWKGGNVSEYSVIIPDGEPYPCKKYDEFTTTSDNQEEVNIVVFEKTNKQASDVIDGNEDNFALYGSFILSGIECAPKGVPKIKVTFNYDLSRTLQVTAEDKITGVSKTVILKKSEMIAPKQGKATDFYVLLDVSGSMGGKRIEQAKIAFRTLVNDTLDLNLHRLGLITFGKNSKEVCELTNNKQYLINAVNSIRTNGSTNMTSALNVAYNNLIKCKYEKAIILITDGDPDSVSTALSEAYELKNKGVSIATIGVEDADTEFLAKVASKSDLNFMVNDVSRLGEAFGKAVKNLLSK